MGSVKVGKPPIVVVHFLFESGNAGIFLFIGLVRDVRPVVSDIKRLQGRVGFQVLFRHPARGTGSALVTAHKANGPTGTFSHFQGCEQPHCRNIADGIRFQPAPLHVLSGIVTGVQDPRHLEPGNVLSLQPLTDLVFVQGIPDGPLHVGLTRCEDHQAVAHIVQRDPAVAIRKKHVTVFEGTLPGAVCDRYRAAVDRHLRLVGIPPEAGEDGVILDIVRQSDHERSFLSGEETAQAAPYR